MNYVHIITISLDEGMVRTAREDGEVVSPMDREFWNIEIRCEADPNDFTRDCMAWWECCQLTAEQLDELAADGDGPCPKSPTGTHRYRVGELSPARPSRGCWAVACEGSSEAVYELADKHHLGPGEYRVHALSTDDGEYVEFGLIEDDTA